ncbi:UNVERIFIED_CONTAM: hypothetical protein GTU68_045609, partial [Idotea baltica]|nr:hypothetical protein [Idotea baltica]
DLEKVLADAKAVGVQRFVCIGAGDDAKSATDSIRIAEQYPEVWASIGVHPCDVDSATLAEVEELASHERVVAIGETGLDFFRSTENKDVQEQVFCESIALAKNLHKPLIIHCRAALDECLSLLIKHKASEIGGVFHCYAESAETARRLADLNFKVSLTGILTFSGAAELREAVAEIPLEQIMLETDCPYMAPTPFRGKPSEPAHVRVIAEKLAEVKGISLEVVAKRTEQTAEKFFGF